MMRRVIVKVVSVSLIQPFHGPFGPFILISWARLRKRTKLTIKHAPGPGSLGCCLTGAGCFVDSAFGGKVKVPGSIQTRV